jgi:hypothetical protein
MFIATMYFAINFTNPSFKQYVRLLNEEMKEHENLHYSIHYCKEFIFDRDSQEFDFKAYLSTGHSLITKPYVYDNSDEWFIDEGEAFYTDGEETDKLEH